MNKITDEAIQKAIEEEWNKLLNIYGNDRIAALFIVGNANYGFADSIDELVFQAVYIPTFEEACLNKPVDLHKSENCELIDIRLIYNLIEQIDLIALEHLYSKYYKINQKYFKTFKEYFLDNKDLISKLSPIERILKTETRALKALEDKNYFEAMRLNVSAHAYLKNDGVSEESFHPTEMATVNYLSSLKMLSTMNKDLCPFDIEDFKQDFENMRELAYDLDNNVDADKIVKTGVLELLKTSFFDRVDIAAFEATLTENEKRAFTTLKEELKNDSIISISRLVEQTNISRPVWNNLLQKMKINKIAEINNKGTKGTQINLFY